jgi:hypothetical protein
MKAIIHSRCLCNWRTHRLSILYDHQISTKKASLIPPYLLLTLGTLKYHRPSKNIKKTKVLTRKFFNLATTNELLRNCSTLQVRQSATVKGEKRLPAGSARGEGRLHWKRAAGPGFPSRPARDSRRSGAICGPKRRDGRRKRVAGSRPVESWEQVVVAQMSAKER